MAQEISYPYLALGDSIPFGFDPTDTTFMRVAEYKGYPYFVSQALPLTLSNASCPGETSASFLNVAAQDNGCKEWREFLPLFVMYASSTQSQMNFAVTFLRKNPATKLVTLTIGGDDLDLLEEDCALNFQTPTQIETCELDGLGRVYANYARNLSEIYLNLRFSGHYAGPIVAATYFSPDYTNLLETGAIAGLNGITEAITDAFGGKVANVFSAFQAASVAGGGLPCANNVGLAYPNPGVPLTCNPHPTATGQQLIATLILNALK